VSDWHRSHNNQGFYQVTPRQFEDLTDNSLQNFPQCPEFVGNTEIVAVVPALSERCLRQRERKERVAF
jgi:hypothetical protein